MKLAFLFFVGFIFLSPFANSYVPRWEKICRSKMKGKTNLYDIYNDCIDICMPEFSLYRDKTIKEKVRVCTLFTARLHNTLLNSGEASAVSNHVKNGIQFCQEQKQHKTGGHWAAISRNCKRVICEYNPKITAENHEECKDIFKHLHNGKVEAEQLPDKAGSKKNEK